MTNNQKYAIIIIVKGVHKMKNIKWNYVRTIEAMGDGFDQYENEDGTLGKNVWFDGYEEIFEIG